MEDNAVHLLLPIAVASGLDREEAIASIASAYKEERTIPTKSKQVVDDDCVGLSTQDLLADTGAAGTQWVWEGIIAKGCMTLVCGSPKAGKSTFLDTLLWYMDNDQGQTQFIENLKPGRILYLAEESKPVLQIRLQVDDLTGIENVTWILKQRQYDLAAFMEYLHRLEDQYLSTNSYDMVILDTLGNWLIIENECDNSKVSVLLNSIKDFFLARHPEVALVLVHHFGKPRKDDARNEAERIRGASAFVQVPDMLVTLSRFNNKDLSDRRRVLHFVGRFHPRAEQVVVELKKGMPRYEVVDLGIPIEEIGSLDGVIHLIENKGAMTLNEVSEVMSVASRTTVHRLLTDGIHEERLIRKGSGRKSDPYSYSIYHHVDWIVKLSSDSGLEDLD